jgi:hypothetical protein
MDFTRGVVYEPRLSQRKRRPCATFGIRKLARKSPKTWPVVFVSNTKWYVDTPDGEIARMSVYLVASQGYNGPARGDHFGSLVRGSDGQYGAEKPWANDADAVACALLPACAS